MCSEVGSIFQWNRKRDLNRRADKSHARDLWDQLIRKYHNDGRSFAHERKTFADLANQYEQSFVDTF